MSVRLSNYASMIKYDTLKKNQKKQVNDPLRFSATSVPMFLLEPRL